jgi:hypothetical protein
MQKFKVTSWDSEIVVVDAVRETNASLWLKESHSRYERKVVKNSTYVNYFDTWEDAWRHLDNRARAGIAAAERALKERHAQLLDITKLKKPVDIA